MYCYKLRECEGRKSKHPGDLQNVERRVVSFITFGRETVGKLLEVSG